MWRARCEAVSSVSFFVPQHNLTLRKRKQPDNGIKQGGFSHAITTKDCEHFTGGNVEVYIMENPVSPGVRVVAEPGVLKRQK